MEHPFQIPYIRLSPSPEAEIISCEKDCKCVIFVGPEAEEQELSDLLVKIINSTGLDKQKETLQLLVTPENRRGFSEVRNLLPQVPILCFGIPPRTLAMQIEPPPLQDFAFAGFTWLFSPSLKELSRNKDKKLKLWNALKKLFDLNP